MEVRPKVTGVIGSCSVPGETEWLTGISTADEVDGFNLAPIDCRDVAEVRHIRVAVGEQPDRCGLNVGMPGDRPPEHLLNTNVEAAVNSRRTGNRSESQT